MTYEDFISAVKKYLKSSQVAFSETSPNNINSDFSVNDIEVGKIYMVLRTEYAGGEDDRQVWFLCPYESITINSIEEGFKFYWCSGQPQGLKKGVIHLDKRENDLLRNKGYSNEKWEDWSWAKGDWVEISSIKNDFINWNELPWGDLK